MDVEATAENCRTKMEAYFKLHLPRPTEESVVVNSKIAQWRTKQTLHQMTEDLSKEMEEDRELQTLESALKQRRLQIKNNVPHEKRTLRPSVQSLRGR